jgi:hypothetical protein
MRSSIGLLFAAFAHGGFWTYAGQTIDVIDGATGEVRSAQIFVAVL